MQTVLSSKVLQRVVFAVIEKVLRTWPKARGGFADCQRYREALQQVLEDVQRHARENQREDRRMHLLIEFVVADQDALVDFIGRSWPRGRRALIFRPANYCSSREYPPRYAGRNLLAIARDSFGLDREDAEELIALEIDP